ncbi:FAD:protein FMN transferase [Chitinivorax sp. PXF-14]|uniref:FAD:protein FMN transferase n=1 Tax=Chitinivorax sp. PXF-14 TaxID=3230488 RepID=UPI0034654242
MTRDWVGAALLLVLSACTKPPLVQQGQAFGTTVSVAIAGEEEPRARQAAMAVLTELEGLSKRWDPWQPSELADLNAALAQGSTPHSADPALLAMLKEARKYESWSDGMFNLAQGRLTELWGFHAHPVTAARPEEAEIKRLLTAAPSLQALSIGDKVVFGNNAFLKLDLNRVARGWLLEREAQTLHGQDIGNALISIGGDSLALGRNGRSDWTVSLPHPRKAGAMATLELKDGETAVTVGDYQRHFELDGKRYSDLIDPRSGWPVSGMQAVTVVVPRASQAGLLAEAVTRPLLFGGVQTAAEYAKRFDVADVLMIDMAGKVYATPGINKRLSWVGDKPEVQAIP